MKFLRYIQKRRRAIFAMTALAIFASPFTAQASSITPKNASDSSKITFKNKVYNIEVQKKLSEQVGVNKFKDFNLSNGHIANIQFDKLQTVANLVDNKISINGTVNALRDKKIGGNLYFLSPNGIAVGATGVINAGSFTGMAVSQSYFDKLSKTDSAHTFMTELAPSKIQYNNDPDKGIDIQGVINAPGGISLYATKINVGQKAVLRTNVEDVDFKKVVNVENVDSGANGELDASYSGGDIVLKAHAEHIADDNMLTNLSGDTATRWVKDTSREAIVNVDGKIDSAGDVNINAESTISFTEGSKWNVVTQSKILESFLGNLGVDVMADGVKRVNKAKIDIGKNANIHSKGAMEIGAEATLSVTLNAETPSLKTGTTKVTQFIPAIAVAVIKADNKAEVNIKGKLESESTMSITANAETTLSNTAKATTQLDQEHLKEQLSGGSSLPEDHNFIAVGVIDGETKADVNISSGSKIKVNGEDNTEMHMDALTIKATTTNTVGNEVSATPNLTNVETATTTAVAVTNYNGESNINLEDEIVAEKGNAVINATNTFINTGETSTGIGADPDAMKFFANIPSSGFLESLSATAAKKMFSSLQLSDIPYGAGGSTFAKIFNGDFLKLGSSVSVFNQDNKAKVNIGKDSSIIAKKDVDISSTNKIAALKLSTTAEVNNSSDAQKNKYMFGIGVQVSNIKNNADAVIKGSINSDAGKVNVTSYAGMNYNTVEALQTKFDEFFKSFRKQFKDGWESLTHIFGGTKIKELDSDFTMYEMQIKNELEALKNAKDPEAYMTALKTLNTKIASAKDMGFSAFVKTLDKGSEIKGSFEGLIPTLTAFLHPSNYTNYYVRSAFSENKNPSDVSSSELSGAGSFSINSMPNTSRVVFAENSKVEAYTSVNVKSNAENRVVAITGMGGEYGTSSTAAEKGAGISVKVGNFKNDSIIAFGKNAKLDSKLVSIDSKEYAKHFNVIYGNGKADSTSVTGMVSYFNSPANNIISIDDSVVMGKDNDFIGTAGIYDHQVNLNADSERYITSVTGALTLGNGNGKSFGATINIMNNPVNNAVVLADNGTGTRSAITGTSLEDKTNAKILTLTNKTLDILGDNKTLLGTSSIDGTGEINAFDFNATAKKTGTINAIAVAGTENSESHGFFDKFNAAGEGLGGIVGIGEMALGLMPQLLSKYVGSKISGEQFNLFHSGGANAGQAAGEALGAAGNEGGGLDAGVNNNVASQLNFAGAGSVAVNMNSGETGAFISNYKINTDTSNVRANDDTFHGSWAGAGAFNFFGDSEIAENTNVAVGGSLALTSSKVNVDSVIKNSTINANDFYNNANRADSDVSAGMGLAVSTNSAGTQVNIPISASINLLNGDTHALLIGNNFKGVKRRLFQAEGGSVSNKATIDSVQVAGGLALGVSKGESKGFSIGGNGAASQITNDLQSGIKGGSYENLRDVDITATKKSNQVDVAVAGGVTAGGGDDSGGFAFGGAVAVSDIKNTANAFLKDTAKFNATGIVNVDALENKNSSSRDAYLLTRKIDIDATSYLANNDKNKIDKINGGGNIVNVAFGGGGSTSGAAAGGLGIAYSGLTNTMNVDIADNQNITAKNFNANTTNKSNIVNVTVGFAGSKGNFSAAGSAGVSDIKNEGTINIKNSNVTADSFLSGAQSSAHIVNVAGQASLADKFAAGLSFAYNAMNNTTGVNIKKGNWNVKEFGANSANNNYALAVGAGVAFSKESSAVNGSIGLNIGTNSTKSIVDDATINGVEKMKVIATDNTSKTTVAGNANISKGGTVAIGGAVAYANIGKASNKEIVNAKITNATITTKNNSSIEVESLEKGIMTTVGAGAGGSVGGASLTFQGAAAVSEVNKDNIAEISNTNITGGTPDIKIKATSGGNSSDGLSINGSKIDVNNKIKTAAAVLDANITNEAWFDGAFAISVNKFNQSTQSNFKNDSRPEIISRAGNVDMYSNSEADILGIGIGGSGGSSTVSAAGSVSYNYINNSAKSLVENANVNADKNFGVVAQSDDKIANYAGTVDVDVNGRGAIGVSVAYNEIKGDTDANIKNSKLTVSGSDKDLIAISNPKDNLIDGYVTRNNWTSGRLMSGRTTANKSGLVVNSSATHTISSDLATIGVRATGSTFGAGVSGTVNINKINGATNAKVESTDALGNANSFVNASDYTNNGSFIGNAAVSGNVAVGVLWNENQVGRKTNALVDGGTLNVKNMDVKADNQQGISNLNIAVGASFMTGGANSKIFAAASGDNIVRNQLEGTTTAKIENATVNHSGKIDVNAYHKDNIYATNIAAGLGVSQAEAFGVGATFDLGYGLMRENSTVEAEINNSTLKSKSGAVNVNAQNDSKLAGAFGTAGVAMHIGTTGTAGGAVAVAVGINNIYLTNTVHAGIKGSTLNVGAVDVNAKNTSEIKADGGVAAVSINISKTFFASLGAAVAVTNGTFDNKVTAEVDKSTIKAGGDVNIKARDDHKSKETVVSAALSTGLAVSVNRMSTSINNGLADLKAEQLGKPLSRNDLVMKTDNASKENANGDSDKLTGEFGDEKRFLNENTINSLLGGVRANSAETKKNIKETLTKRYTAMVNYNNSLKKGVFANVQNNSTIEAGDNKISIGSTENNDLAITSGSGNAGPIGIGVGSTSIKVRRANTANVIGSSLKAKNIDISTTNGQTGSDGINSRMYNASIAVVGVSVGYNNVETNGTGEILISNSKITAGENLNAKAVDNSKSRSYILDAGLKGAGYTGVFAYNTNTSQTGIEVSDKSALEAKAINFAAQNQSYRATDTLAISASGVNVPTSTSEAKDMSTNFISVKDAGNTFRGDEINFTAQNSGQTYSHINGQAYLGLNAIIAKGRANSNINANINIADANTFKAGTANITAQIGEENKYTAETTGFAINGSAIGINVDNMYAETKSMAAVNIGNEIYNDDTTLNVSALNKASRNSFMRNNAYSLVANANDISAYTIAEDSSSITVGSNTALANSNKLGALNINADTENKSYVAAKGTGGSIGGDFGSAAHADNSVNNTSSATLNGTWNITDALKMNANQRDSAYISGYSARGAILTGGKGSLDNVIKGSSTAKISDGATINAKTVNVNSKNYIKTDKYSNDYDYTLFGRMGGVVDDVDYQRSTATTTKSANINIGKNVAITTTGTQTYDAASDYDLKNNVYAEGGSLLMSLRWSKSHNYITADEKISVGKDAQLKNEGGTYADGGITMAAHDKLELAPTAKGFSQAGLGGYVRAETLLDLTRNQNIDINGTVKSAKDLNLYAGADINGDGSKVHSYAQAISQVQTLFSDGSADIIRRGATNSNVNVNGGAYGQATRNVNVISNAGYEVYEERPYYGSTWSSDGGYKVATADTGNLTTGNYKHNNKVKVDGELKAASTPDVTINISGVAIPDGFILADKNAKNLSYNVQSGDITITKKNTDFAGMSSEKAFAQQIYNGITTSDVDYANDFLKTRYAQICQAISNYQVQGRNDVAAYNGFLQEKIALENEMEKLGLGSYDKGEFKLDSSASIDIKTVVLPDVEVSGGNINVSTNDFSGTGKLNASGVPKIDINNKSSAYLITNRLTIADKGGAITYNGRAVTSNADISRGAKFAEIKTSDSANVSTISVANNYSGQTSIAMKPNPNAKGYDTLRDDAKKATLQYTPINYIEVTKDITNPVGKVIINNKQGSIRINKGAAVNAQDVEMTAKESISQGYTEGIINIAYTPENVYKDEIAKLREELGWSKTIPTKDQTITKSSDNIYKGGSGRIAGDAIYISARDININGLIQSGFLGYKASVTQKDVDSATETAFFNGVSMYKVNSGGTRLGSDGYYIYEPQVYYDKANNKLYVEDINAAGGKVYLTGRISSTGNGKIVVSDGGGNIDIKNSSKVDMNVGNVRTSGGGFIQIVDTEQDKLSEYSSGQTRTIDNYSAWLADNTKGKVATGDGLTVGNFVNYNPKSGLTYSWGEGTRRERTDHYYYKEEKWLWGFRKDSKYTSNLSALSKVVDDLKKDKDYDPKKASTWSEPEKSEILDVGNGVYIGTKNAISGNLTLLAQNVTTKESYGNHTIEGPEKHGFIGYYRDYTHRWTKTTGAKQIYQYSLKADYPISMGIIGESNPAINLTNSATSDLYLTGNIRNDNGLKLNITARGGKIEQSGGIKISTDNIKLTARDGIKNINLVNHRTDDLKLNAQTNTGDLDINVTGGILGDKQLAGNVIVDALKNNYDDVKLTAQGSIKQTIKGTSVNARDIKLESTNGAINLQIESNGQSADVSAISAAANGDIKLTKNDNADFRIGSIVSTAGDVTLTAKGKFVDALNKERDNVSNDESGLVKSWIDMGLIAGTADYKGAYITRLEKDRDAYKSDVTEQFSEYKTLLATYQSAITDYNSLKDEDKTKVTAPQKNDRLILLDKKFSKYETADAYLAADKDYQTLVATVKNPQYKWTEDELLSSVRSAIVNKQEGTAYDVTRLKDANITAKNVTLTGAGVGTNSKETTTIKMSELRVKANETDKEKSARLAKVSQLANVEAADVKVNLALDSDGKPITQTVTQINYNYDADKGYYIDKAGNYIRYRKDADGNLLKYTYDKNLKQIGNAVAVDDFSNVIKSTTTIENKEIESFDISGTIPLGINATGNISVTATGSDGVYIAGRNKGVKITETQNPNNDIYSALNVNKIETSKADGNLANVRIIGEAGIFNAADSGANVVGKDLVLVGGNGAIGTQAKPFAVSLSGDLLSARANDEINLQNVGADNFRISALYSPKNIRITNTNGIIEHSTRFDDIAAAYINTPGEITLTGSAGTANNPILIFPHEATVLNLKSGENFYIKGLNSGAMNLNELSGNVEISSDGSIGQTKNAANNLTSMKVSAKGDVILDGTKNKFSEISLGAIGGNFELKNNSDKLTANFGGTIKGNATINQTGDINLAGAINGNILNLTSEKGNITSTGGLKATKEINLSVGAFEHKGEIHTDKLTIATDSGVTLNNPENTFNALEISSRSGNAINGSIDIAIKANKFAPTIRNDVTGDVTLENSEKSGAMSFGSGETINISGTFKAKTLGDFDYGSALNAGKGISIDAQNIYRRENTTGNFSTQGTTLFKAKNNIGTAANPIWFSNAANKSAGLDLFGKGIYIKGVNSGILTLGDVVGTSFSASSEGSIAQADKKLVNLDKLELTATNDITLDNDENRINSVQIIGDNVKLHSKADSGLILDGLKAKGDVMISSEKSLKLNGNIETEKNIALAAGTNLTSSKASVLKSGDNITMKADDVKLSGKVEMPYKKMTSNKVEDLEKFIAEMPVIEVTTNKGLDMQNAANSFNGVYVDAGGELINGSVLVLGNSPAFLAVIDKSVVNNITLKNKKSDGEIILLDKGALKSKKGITLEMDGDFSAAAALEARNISITSHKGSITIAQLSSLTETEQNNSKKIDTLKAIRNVTLKVAKTIEIEGRITAGGNLKANSAGIDVVGKADVSAGNIDLSIDKGNLMIEGKIRANTGAIDIKLGEGNVRIGNETTKHDTVVFAKKDINMTTSNGTIDISGKPKSTSGNINIKAQKTTPKNTSANVIETDSATLSHERPGDINIDAEVEANKSIWIVTDEGNIKVAEKITVNDGSITITTMNGNINIYSDIRAQNNLNIETENGAVDIAGKVATRDGDINISSNQGTYTQKGIIVEETGAINPAKNVNLNVQNGDIEFKNISAQNAFINSNIGNVTADTISAADTIRIALERGDLYLNLAQSKGVAILTGDSSKAYVKTIRADSMDVSDAVTVGKVLPYRSTSASISPSAPTSSGGSSSGSGTSYSKVYGGSYSRGGYSNFASNPSSFATLGTTYTNDGLTYWQSATSSAVPDYSFSEFNNTANDISYRQTRNYFEVKFIPTWLEKEFMSIDSDYSFDNFGIRNATEDELTID